MEDLAPHLGCLLAAIYFHKTLLHGVLRAPITFFDITPTGRILSRFSKDVDVLDNGLSREISDTIYCIFEVNVVERAVVERKTKHTQNRNYFIVQ